MCGSLYRDAIHHLAMLALLRSDLVTSRTNAVRSKEEHRASEKRQMWHKEATDDDDQPADAKQGHDAQSGPRILEAENARHRRGYNPALVSLKFRGQPIRRHLCGV